ncbi:unnamed protein product [Linum trigynum]|uniref:Uncharacterized protein n=1 Tax=Linum trigynum TaxID=586398 RepID=A0AAV2ELI7_9ROSI
METKEENYLEQSMSRESLGSLTLTLHFFGSLDAADKSTPGTKFTIDFRHWQIATRFDFALEYGCSAFTPLQQSFAGSPRPVKYGMHGCSSSYTVEHAGGAGSLAPITPTMVATTKITTAAE